MNEHPLIKITDEMVLAALNAEYREQYRSWGRIDPETGEVRWEDRTRLDEFGPSVVKKTRAALRAAFAVTPTVLALDDLADRWESAVSSYDYEAAMQNAATDLRTVLNGENA